jgi:hypothetical protein
MTRWFEHPRRRALVVLVACAIAVVVDLAVGAAVPGRMAAVALGGTFLLVLGAKRLGAAGLSRPLGSRPGDTEEVPYA